MVQVLLTTVVCDFCSGAICINNLSFQHLDCGYNCCRVLKHVSKSLDIFSSQLL